MTLSFLVKLKDNFAKRHGGLNMQCALRVELSFQIVFLFFLCSSSFPFVSILGVSEYSSHPVTAQDFLYGVS